MQGGADKVAVAKKEVAKQEQSAAPNPPVENKTENKPAAETAPAKDALTTTAHFKQRQRQQQAAETKAAIAPVAAVPLVAAAKEAVQAAVPVAQEKSAEQTVAKTEPVLPLEGTTAQAPAAEKLEIPWTRRVRRQYRRLIR